MNEYVESDMERYGAKPGLFGFLRLYRANRAFRWQVAFRLVNSKGIEKLGGGYSGRFAIGLISRLVVKRRLAMASTSGMMGRWSSIRQRSLVTM